MVEGFNVAGELDRLATDQDVEPVLAEPLVHLPAIAAFGRYMGHVNLVDREILDGREDAADHQT